MCYSCTQDNNSQKSISSFDTIPQDSFVKDLVGDSIKYHDFYDDSLYLAFIDTTIENDQFYYDTCNTLIQFKEFSFEILKYLAEDYNEKPNSQSDTIFLAEGVFKMLSNRRLNIHSKAKGLKFEIEFAFNDCIFEQYNLKKIKEKDLEKWEKKWEKNRLHWEGMTKYRKLEENKNKSFVFPNILEMEYCEKLRKREQNLKDTFVDCSGETDNIATLIYKGKPALHRVIYTFLKINVYQNGEFKYSKWIRIENSYGC